MRNTSTMMFTLAAGFVLLVLCLISLPSLGQEELDDNRVTQTREDPVHSMSEPVYRRLSAAHEQLGDNLLDESLATLRKLEKTRLSKYEKAIVYQTLGFVYSQKSDNTNATRSFEQALELESLPGQVHQQMLYSLAGLYAAEGQFAKSTETIREWFRYEEDPAADAYMMIGGNYTQLEKFSDALPYVLKAIDMAEEPKQNWYMLALAIHFEEEHFGDAIPVLIAMLNYWPDTPRYWDMLAGAYMETGADQKALDTMMLAYTNEMLTGQSQLIALVQLNMLQGIPYTAGNILAAELGNETIDENKRTLDMLLQAWLSAREFDRAVDVIARLAPYAEGGEYFLQAAGIYTETGEWQKVTDNAVKALDATVKKPVDALMLAGAAYTELDRFADALASFRRVRDLGNSAERRNANSWINFVEEKRRTRENKPESM